MEITISQEAYDNYIKHSSSNHPQNTRLRPENEDFLDALLSVDMTDTPEGREILDAISKLD